MVDAVGLREIVPNSCLPERCREFNIHTGGTQSTLQDVKLPNVSGGFVYADQNHYLTRNRHILWRTNHDNLELIETSLDWDLRKNRVRYRFQDTPVLSGVSIHETHHHVVILVATVSSVHKMRFPHPRCVHKQDIQNGPSSSETLEDIPSIFADATSSTPMEHYHVLSGSGVISPLPHASASWLDRDEEAIFALANDMEGITLIKLGSMKGIYTVDALKMSSYLGRLWDNIGGMLSSTKSHEGHDSVLSLAIHPIQNDVYIFALCKDHRLRMWLTSTRECVMTADLISQQKQGQVPLMLGAQSHMLRKVSSHPNGFALAAFLCFSDHSEFCVFRPVRVDGQFDIKHIATVYAPEYDLIDYSVSPNGRIVALWTNPDGVPILRYAKFGHNPQGETSTGWNDIILEGSVDPNAAYNVDIDPRQVYLKQLFWPGRFSIETLSKTLNIFRRSADVSFIANSDEFISVQKLKEEICAAVEVEIQNQINEYEISDEEHIAISHSAWGRFYSCAVQYHETGLVPMGLVVCNATGLMIIIKKDIYSFVRPLETLEHLVLHEGNGLAGARLFQDIPGLCDDPLLAQDVVNLMKAVALISERFTYEMEEEFNSSLRHLESPDKAAEKIVTEILTDENFDCAEMGTLSFTQKMGSRLQQIGDVTKALEVLSQCLELDRGIVSYSAFDPSVNVEPDQRSRLFASTKGRSVVAESLKQFVHSRFVLTRHLIVLQQIIQRCGFPDEVPDGTTERIHSTFLPHYVVLNLSYFILTWITETNATAPPSDSLEQGLRQMAVLKISRQNTGTQHAAQIARTYPRPLTLSELFLLGPASKARHLLISNIGDGGESPWQSALIPLVNICAQLLWPKCAVSAFQGFLLSACQHMQIQEYVRLMSTWCEHNCHSRQFLLGSALLNMGEPEKAYDWMIQAAGGIGVDTFLAKHLFSAEEIDSSLADCTADQLTVMYYLKIIALFEQFGYYENVIDLANTALAVCDENDRNRTTLCFTLFSHHLKLGHYEKAYDAMVANPDQSRRKDSLRQFVVTLFERKQFKQLAFFPYIDMFEDLEQIIETRARSVDLSVNNYYDFLYSFHVSKENFRKAAYVMYECAMRISTEMVSMRGLQQQVRCYLACLNALKLVNKDYAWIVKPVLKVSTSDSSSNSLPPGVSPKHSHEGHFKVSAEVKPRMNVLEIKDIEKEFVLVSARLKLASLSSKNKNQVQAVTGPTLSSSDALALLVAANLYVDAVKIATVFKVDLRPVVEGLASRCVYLSRSKPSEKDLAWDWLAENNFGECGAATSVEAAWSLLKKIVQEQESGKSTTSLKKAIAIRLMVLGTALPAWLVNAYKSANPAELLHLYLSHGFIIMASNFAVEFIEAALGNGCEYFGFANALHAQSAPIWLPFNLFDQLMLELKDHIDNPVCKKHYLKINQTLDNYMSTVKRVSKDMIAITVS